MEDSTPILAQGHTVRAAHAAKAGMDIG